MTGVPVEHSKTVANPRLTGAPEEGSAAQRIGSRIDLKARHRIGPRAGGSAMNVETRVSPALFAVSGP